MMNRRKNFNKIFFNQKFLTLLGLAVIILISFPFTKNTLKQYRINKEISEFKKEIFDLQNKNIDLKNFVSYLESDQFVEEQARLNLGLKKPGEEVLVVKNEIGEASVRTSSSSPIFNIPGYEKMNSELNDSNFKKWLDYFFR